MLSARLLPLAAAILTASGLVLAGIAPGAANDRNAADPSIMRVVMPEDEAEDVAVTANVRSAIAACVGTGAALIHVETRVAIVTLSGEAASPEIRDRARAAALIVSGVIDVIDRINVKSTA
jgi:osmotically-inducible protein OsmY